MRKITTLIMAFLFGLSINAQNALITGYVDSPCSGADGRTIEIYVDGSVDFTDWNLVRQSNGGAFDFNIDISSLGTVTDDFAYVTNDEATLDVEFGITNNVFENGGISGNGDDAFQLTDVSDAVIDRFGEDGVDGSDTDWEYEDTYAYRNDESSPNAGTFDSSNWTFGALGLLNDEGDCNGGDPLQQFVPFGSFQPASASLNPGESCSDPIVISTLPYNTTDDTSNYGNNYSGADRPDLGGEQVANGTGSDSYLSGDDAVYEFTPTESGVYNFNLSNTLDDWIGFWLFEGCEPFTSIVGRHTATSGTTRSLPEVSLQAGTTYNVVISTWAAPDSTPYTLDVDQVTCPTPQNISLDAVSAVTAELVWDDLASADNYNWVLVESGDSPDETDDIIDDGTTSDSFVSVSGLTAETDYDLYVEANCGDDGTSGFAEELSFTTTELCASPENLSVTNTTSSSAEFQWDESLTASNGYLWFLMTDGENPEDDTPIDSGILADGETTASISDLSANTTYDLYLQSNCGDDGESEFISVSFTTTELCASPENLSVTNTTVSSAEFQWDESLTASDGYLWFLMADDENPEDDTPVDSGTLAEGETTASISDLSANTTYDIYLQSNCGDDGESESISVSFTTSCLPGSVPSFEEFETTSQDQPDCWSSEVLSGTNDWELAQPGDFGDITSTVSGDGIMQKNYNSSDAVLYSLPLDYSTVTEQTRINTWLHRHASADEDDEYIFYVNTTQSLAGATEIFQLNSITTSEPTVPSTGFYNYTIDIPDSFHGEDTVYIIVQGITNAGFSSYALGIDDFGVEYLPACPEVQSFQVSNVGSDSVDLSWDEVIQATSGHELFLYMPGDDPEEDSAIDSQLVDSGNTSASFTGLSASTDYEVYINSVCGDDGTSELVGPLEFLTTPVNDDVCDAIALTVGDTSSGDQYSNIGSTAQPDEPTENLNSGVNGSVWFTFEAPDTGYVEISTDIPGGTMNDSEIAVYAEPSDCSDLSTFGEQLGFDQDGGDIVGDGYMSILEISDLIPGNTYYIQVDRYEGFGSVDGTFGIEITELTLPTATAQIIHNSPDPGASMVDVYVDGELALDDFEFRTATEFIELPADVEIDIDIAPSNSTDVSESIYTMSTTLAEDENYTIVANGVLDPTQFDDSVNTIDFTLDVFTGAQDVSGDPTETDVLVHHGSPDAPTVDIVETSVPAGILVDDISYSEFDGYLNLASGDYTIDVTSADGSTVVASYEAPLATLELEGQALTVLASGFLDPSLNQDGAAFGLWVALPDGGDLVELQPAVQIPSNDNVCDAIPLTVGATSAGDAYTNVNSTAETDEPEGDCFNGGINGSVWFTFEAPASGEVEISTDILGGTMNDSEIALYEAPSDCNDLTTFGTELECDQDGGDVVGSGYMSIIEADALVPGDTYYIQVDRYEGLGSVDGTFGIEVKDANPPCPEPENLMVDNISSDSADLTWDDVTEATEGFEWQVFESGDNPETDSPIIDGSTNAGEMLANLTGLTSNTTYDAYVLSDCDTNGTSILSSVVTFSTLCDTVYDVPFNETFNSDSDSENCWIVLDENEDGDAWDLNYDSNPFEGNEVAALYTDFNSGDNDDWLISPSLNLTGNEQVTFQMRVQSSGEPNDFEVLLSTSGNEPSDFTETVLALDSYDNDEYQEITVDLSSYSGEVNLAWHVPQGGPDGWRLYVDDVNVSEIPLCIKPTNVQVNNVEAYTADISWDDEPTASLGYEWFVFESGDDPENDTPVTSDLTIAGETSASVSGLDSDTEYDVYVQSDCDTDGNSDLSNVVTFTTEISCFDPENVVVNSTTLDGANISWDEEENASNGYIWSVFEAGGDPENDTAIESGTTDNVTFTANITGLPDDNTQYDFYVQSDCDADGLSVLEGPISFFTKPEAVIVSEGMVETNNYCYGNDDFQQWLFTSDDGSPLVINFTQGSVEANTFAGDTFDDLVIYDGTDETGTVLYDSDQDISDVGDLSVLSFVADSGSMFITLESDVSNSCDTGQQTEIIFDVFIEEEPATATAQIIHNSPDPGASMVDVYVDGELALDDFEFRTATEFIELPADEEIDIDIAPSNSTDVSESIYTMSTTLAEDESYTIVANGVLDPTQFDDSVNTIDFTLDVFTGAQGVSGDPAETDVLVHHGSPDAPTVDIVETSVPAGILVDDISYSEFDGYLNLASGDYTIDVTSADGSTVVASYEAPLATLELEGQALTVLASGFLDPSLNQDGAAFGLWVALPDGGDLIELSVIPQPVFARAQIIHNSPDPAASIVDVYLNGELAIDDLEFRNATEFIDVPADTEIDIDIAPSTSSDVSESIYNLNTTLVEDETYIVVADGVLDPSQFDTSVNDPIDFGLEVYSGGQEVALDPANTDVLVHHGAPDAPAVDVIESDSPVFTDLAYTDFQGYAELVTENYVFDVSGPDGVLESYEANLADLELDGAAIVVLASGFLTPEDNQNGEGFGLWAALASGGPLVELPVDDVSTDDFNANNFSFYPNPVKDMLNIKTSLEIEEVTVFNMLGQTVVKVKPETANPSLNLENLQAGAYLVKVESNGKTNTFRIIKD